VLAGGTVIADGAPMQAMSSPILLEAYGVEADWVEGAGGPMLDMSIGAGAI